MTGSKGRTESIDPEKGITISSAVVSPSASPPPVNSATSPTGNPTSSSPKRKSPRPTALNVKLISPSKGAAIMQSPSSSAAVGASAAPGGAGIQTANHNPYGKDVIISESVPTPDTPYLTDPLWGRFYLPHGRFGIPAMLRFIFCPSFQHTRSLTLCGNIRIRLPTFDSEQQSGYLRQIFSLTTAILIVQAVLLGCMTQIAIVPTSMNNLYGPSIRTLVAFGAKEAGLIIHQAQWWRIISSLFLQAGLVEYVLMALLTQRVGAFLEFRWGLPTWIAIWSVAGSFGMVVSVALRKDRVVVGGASAMAGLLGAWLIEQISLIQKAQPPTLETIRQGRAELLMLIICLIITFALSFASYNDIIASLASLFMGAILGLTAFPIKLEGDEHRHIMLLRVLSLIVGCGVYLFAALYLAFMEIFPATQNELDHQALA